MSSPYEASAGSPRPASPPGEITAGVQLWEWTPSPGPRSLPATPENPSRGLRDCVANSASVLDVLVPLRLFSESDTYRVPIEKRAEKMSGYLHNEGLRRDRPLLSDTDVEMIARIQTDLPTSAERAWQALIKRDTFLYITRGLLGFAGADQWPEEFRQGDTIETRLLFFHLLPTWRHTLHVVGLDRGQERADVTGVWRTDSAVESPDSHQAGGWRPLLLHG